MNDRRPTPNPRLPLGVAAHGAYVRRLARVYPNPEGGVTIPGSPQGSVDVHVLDVDANVVATSWIRVAPLFELEPLERRVRHIFVFEEGRDFGAERTVARQILPAAGEINDLGMSPLGEPREQTDR